MRAALDALAVWFFLAAVVCPPRLWQNIESPNGIFHPILLGPAIAQAAVIASGGVVCLVLTSLIKPYRP